MHGQPYPEFTYGNTLMNDTSLTPLPETEYVRQQEDVFSELISLANRRQHHNNPPPTCPPPQLSSSSYSYPTHLAHHSLSTATPNMMTAGPSLLSSSSSTPLAAAAAAAVAPPSLAGATWDHSPHDRIYELKVVQQPYRARMCGFGDKDRRPISPPPILQMWTRTKDGHLVKPESIDISFFIVLCDSWHEDGTTEANLVYHSFSSPPPTQPQQRSSTSSSSTSSITASQQHHLTPTNDPASSSNDEITKTLQMRNLVGSSVASAAKLYDLDGNLGIFFVFQDISFRTEGKFKLAFSLIDVGSPCGNTVNTGSSSQVLTRVFTDMFTVFTAKKFPGVVKSTALSQCFAKQGVKIPIRKDTQVKRKKSTKQASSSFENTMDGTLPDDDIDNDEDVEQ
ncbi:velvet factor-domain-containing protein [Absidia repens]|uniref:Velvet factor-domain-containing protein n=1 Tax=Absidia repens TaxID=90262 RepID=A0A1X2IDQ6_9FUNG|nr:velvet factor-domain-containing protein [Absidia repens]